MGLNSFNLPRVVNPAKAGILFDAPLLAAGSFIHRNAV